MFNVIKEKLQKIYNSITLPFHALFKKTSIDQQTIDELYQLFIKADVGVTTTKKLLKNIQDSYDSGTIQSGSDILNITEKELALCLKSQTFNDHSQIFLLVGINGSGKTTFAGKLANHFKQKNKSVILAAADTFRAAAPEQLDHWAKETGATVIIGKPNQDPAAVAFTACESYKKSNTDILIIDTAGRLQNKDNLMKELEKIKRIITKQLEGYSVCTLLTIDAMLGQNSFSQAKIFNESTTINGIILTKMDGTAKGGIVFSIIEELKIPIAYLSWGEGINDMESFNHEQYLQNLLGESTIFKSTKHKQK